MTESNGRVRLSWAQIVWGISMLTMGLGAWYSLSAKLDLALQEFHLFVQADKEDRDRLWKAIDEARAGERPASPTKGKR